MLNPRTGAQARAHDACCRSNEWNVRCHDKGRVLYVVPALDAYPDGEAAPPPGGSFEEWQQRQWLLAEVVAKGKTD